MKRQDYIILTIIVIAMLGFYFLRPDFNKVFPFFLGFVFSYGFLRFLSHHKKHTIQTDEMMKKAGYSSLALSFQLLMLTGLLLSSIDVFIPFLEKYSAGDVIVMMIILGGLSVGLSTRYYSHHPDKTGL